MHPLLRNYYNKEVQLSNSTKIEVASVYIAGGTSDHTWRVKPKNEKTWDGQ